MGGLSKKAFEIERTRKSFKEHLLVVDSGNLLFHSYVLATTQHNPSKITASGLLTAYHKMGYNAIAVGPYDLAAGIGFLKGSGNQRLPWISANLLDSKNIPVFSPWLIKRVGTTRIGIIGLTNTASVPPSGLHVVDWQTVLPKMIRKLSSRCDHIILLSNLSKQDDDGIARQYPSIDIIISGDLRYRNFGPVIIHNTLIAQTTGEGKYIGTLTVVWGSASGWALSPHMEFLHHQKNIMTPSILSSFRAKFIPLSKSIHDSIEMNRFLLELKQRIRAAEN